MKTNTSILEYGRFLGQLPPESLREIFKAPNPKLLKLYFSIFGFTDPASHVRYPVVTKFCDPKKDDLLLDVGCGHGTYANGIAAKFGSKCIGIDMNNENLRKAILVSSTLGLKNRFLFMNAEKLDFPVNYFNKVICIEMLEHIPKDKQALREIARVLKPGGLFVLSVPKKSMSDDKESKAFAHSTPLGHVRSGYTYETLKSIIDNTGLKIIAIDYWYRRFIKIALQIMYVFTAKNCKAGVVAIYPFLVPLTFLDKLDNNLTYEKGWFRNYIILAQKPI